MNESARCQMLCNQVIRQPHNADTSQGRIDHQVCIAKRHRTIDIDIGARTTTFKIPSIERAAKKSKAYASMLL